MVRALLASLLLTLVLSACGDTDARQHQLAEQVTVSEFAYARIADGTRIVTGTLHNDSARNLDNVQLRIALYDAHNRRVSSIRVVVQDVPSHGDRPFRHPVPTDVDAEGARVQSVLVL
jgi:hypothetical protein